MKSQDYSTTISVDQSPEQVFAAINNVRGWWSGDIEGATDTLGAEFTYRDKDMRRSKQKIGELILQSQRLERCGKDVGHARSRPRAERIDLGVSQVGAVNQRASEWATRMRKERRVTLLPATLRYSEPGGLR